MLSTIVLISKDFHYDIDLDDTNEADNDGNDDDVD